MKKLYPFKKNVDRKGFALVSTIMISSLLLILALGMMSYSSSVTKESTITGAQEKAQANAKIALLTAIGKLQMMAGPDQVATATGWMMGENARHRHLAGVWESFRVNPVSPPTDYDEEKTTRFKGWLVSNTDENAISQSEFALNGNFTNEVKMLAAGTLGPNALAEDYVYAGKVAINDEDGNLDGHIAYVGLDESVKGRANLSQPDERVSILDKVSSLGVASRAAVEKILPPSYDPDTAQTQKFISLDAMTLGVSQDLGEYTHDLSVWSRGVMSNVVDGGLRHDLNLAADGATPAELNGKRVYTDNFQNNESAPYWQQILDYASYYKKIEAIGGIPHATPIIPSGYSPFTGSGSNISVDKSSPNGMVLMPVVAKVQVVFSVTTRNAHTFWSRALPQTVQNMRYMGFLTYSPVVTLYNPYNVALRFDEMELEFRDVPVGFRFFRNGIAQSNQLVPLDRMYLNENDRRRGKAFKMLVKNNGESSNSEEIILKPGESRVFSPYFPSDMTWGIDNGYFDWQNNLTTDITGAPGWEGAGIGFSIDWLTPTDPNYSVNDQDEDKAGVLGLKWRDSISIEFGPAEPITRNKKMTITSSLKAGSNTYPASVIEIDYENLSNLNSLLSTETGETFTFPASGEAPLQCSQLWENDATPVRDYIKGRPFAVFSVYAKTTKGGSPGLADGRYYNKTWSYTNPLSTVNSAVLDDKGKAAMFSYELNLESLPGSVDEQVQVDVNNRGNFITGHTSLSGLKFGTHSELPIGPILSVANLQNANLCASGFQPKFDYAVANSLSHPLLTINKVEESEMLDHSYLLNHYLFDKFYCSTIADLTEADFANSGRTALQTFNDFVSGDKLLDKRFTYWQPAGGIDKLKNLISTKPDEAYKMVAATQMIQGPWNVNSLSVEGWKMVLAGLNGIDFSVYDALSNAILDKQDATNIMSRFSLPNGGVDFDDNVNARQNRWLGYKELKDDELQLLAEEIVKEVRLRGPFLSLTEFVNRRLSSDQELMLRGALEAAIDRANLNEDYQLDGNVVSQQDISSYNFANPEAALGDTTQGAPGRISQGHLLNTLGNAITVRSDTYTIRAYGDSVDSRGNVVARAWCEAVLQRVPDYLDPTDSPEVEPSALMSEVNKNFGRKFEMISFRWLNSNEMEM